MSQYNVKRVLILTDSTIHATGIPERIADLLKQHSIESEIFDGVHVEPTDDSMDKADGWKKKHPELQGDRRPILAHEGCFENALLRKGDPLLGLSAPSHSSEHSHGPGHGHSHGPARPEAAGDNAAV